MSIDPRKKSIEIVKRSKPRSESHKMISQDSFLDGFVSKVTYQDDDFCLSLWVVFTSKHESYAEQEGQLIQQMDAAVLKSVESSDWIKTFFNITGWLAVILFGVLAYLLVTEKVVPEFLKAAFLTVIGFYFGGLIHDKNQNDGNGG